MSPEQGAANSTVLLQDCLEQGAVGRGRAPRGEVGRPPSASVSVARIFQDDLDSLGHLRGIDDRNDNPKRRVEQDLARPVAIRRDDRRALGQASTMARPKASTREDRTRQLASAKADQGSMT